MFGWVQKAIVLLDADKEVKCNQDKYINDHFNIDQQCVKILSDFDKHFRNKSVEDIEAKFNTKIQGQKSKQLIQLYISECYQEAQIGNKFSFIIKEELKPFISAVDTWISEKLI